MSSSEPFKAKRDIIAYMLLDSSGEVIDHGTVNTMVSFSPINTLRERARRDGLTLVEHPLADQTQSRSTT